jgi:hypothetical protein
MHLVELWVGLSEVLLKELEQLQVELKAPGMLPNKDSKQAVMQCQVKLQHRQQVDNLHKLKQQPLRLRVFQQLLHSQQHKLLRQLVDSNHLRQHPLLNQRLQQQMQMLKGQKVQQQLNRKQVMQQQL